MTFNEYLRTTRITDNPRGDFIRDARDDREFPDIRSWDQLHGYLLLHQAIPEAVAAGREAWRSYQRHRAAMA